MVLRPWSLLPGRRHPSMRAVVPAVLQVVVQAVVQGVVQPWSLPRRVRRLRKRLVLVLVLVVPLVPAGLVAKTTSHRSRLHRLTYPPSTTSHRGRSDSSLIGPHRMVSLTMTDRSR